MTTSPVISPRPALQALNTTKSAFSFKSRISPDVNNPLLLAEARAIAPSTPERYDTIASICNHFARL
jgi:hypothetical protein